MKKTYEKLLEKYKKSEVVFQEFCESITTKDLEGLTLAEIIELYGAMSNTIDGDVVYRENTKENVDYIYGKEILNNKFTEENTANKKLKKYLDKLDKESDFLQEMFTESLSGEDGDSDEVSGRITELEYCQQVLNEIINPAKSAPNTEQCPF